LKTITQIVSFCLCCYVSIFKAQNRGALQLGPYANELLPNQTPVHVKVSKTPNGITVFSKQQRIIIDSLLPGICNFSIYIAGFEPLYIYEMQIDPGKTTRVEDPLIPQLQNLDTVEVVASQPHNAVSHLALTWNELYRMPGTALDITKAMQSYPGILPKSGFGYHLSFRGGASFETAYFIDGFPVSTINHFAIQGASGGPNALFNMDFVKQLNLAQSAMHSEFGNALSAAVRIEQREARADRWGGRLTQGGTDYGLMLEGPLGKNAGLQVSARNSFSQYYLKAFNVPVLPAYSDLQYRLHIHLNANSDVLLTGIGGWDQYQLNTQGRASDALLYNIGYIPQGRVITQMSGLRYRVYKGAHMFQAQISVDYSSNTAIKFKNNSQHPTDLIFNFNSTDFKIHSKLQHDYSLHNQVTISSGVVHSSNPLQLNLWQKELNNLYLQDTVSLKTQMQITYFALYSKVKMSAFQDKISAHVFLRTEQWALWPSTNSKIWMSPAAMLSIKIFENYKFQLSYDCSRQLPPGIALLYNAVNQRTEALVPITSQQFQGHIQYQKSTQFSASLTAYYKYYTKYPLLLNDSISYANAMAAYVSLANQPVIPESKGYSYGILGFVQYRLKNGFYGQCNINFIRSWFTNKNSVLSPSVWDPQFYSTLSLGRVWGKAWHMGFRLRYSSGTPYTPYDLLTSSKQAQWDLYQRGVYDFNRVNSKRLPAFYQLDLRLEKTYTFKSQTFTWFLDLSNATGAALPLMPYLTVQRDANNQPLLDSALPGHYKMLELPSDTGRPLPTLGLIWNF